MKEIIHKEITVEPGWRTSEIADFYENKAIRPADGLGNSTIVEGFNKLLADLTSEETPRKHKKADNASRSKDYGVEVTPERGTFQWIAEKFGAKDELVENNVYPYDSFSKLGNDEKLASIDTLKRIAAGTVYSWATGEKRKVRGEDILVSKEASDAALNAFAGLDQLEQKIRGEAQKKAEEKPIPVPKNSVFDKLPLKALSTTVVLTLLATACTTEENRPSVQEITATETTVAEVVPYPVEATPTIVPSQIAERFIYNPLEDRKEPPIFKEVFGRLVKAEFITNEVMDDLSDARRDNLQKVNDGLMGVLRENGLDGNLALLEMTSSQVYEGNRNQGLIGIFVKPEITPEGTSSSQAYAVIGADEEDTPIPLGWSKEFFLWPMGEYEGYIGVLTPGPEEGSLSLNPIFMPTEDGWEVRSIWDGSTTLLEDSSGGVNKFRAAIAPPVIEEPTPTEPEPTPTTQEVRGIAVNEEDPFKVEINQVSYEDVKAMSDEDIIAMSPELDATKYFKEVQEGEKLTASEVLRLGEEGKDPFVLFKDSEGKVRMWADLGAKELEHVNHSGYKDDQTGFEVNSYLVTDNSWREQGLWWGLDANGEEALSREFFRHNMAFNNWYTNHYDSYKKTFLDYTPGAGWPKLFYMSLNELRSNQGNALNMLRADINSISPENPLKINVGDRDKITLTEKKIDVIYKSIYSNNVSGGKSGQEFVKYINYSERTDNTNRFEIEAKMNRNYYFQDVRGSNFVGGFLVRLLRDRIPGFGVSGYNLDGKNFYSGRSISDLAGYDLCGEEKMNNYLRSIGGDFYARNVVPHFDGYNPGVPVCLITENR